jgi:hypothetical protein
MSRTATSAADAGRVDQENRLTVAHDGCDDRIARGASLVTHDDAARADQGVDQTRLADVGTTDDRNRDGRRHVLLSHLSGKPTHNGVEQVARPLAV